MVYLPDITGRRMLPQVMLQVCSWRVPSYTFFLCCSWWSPLLQASFCSALHGERKLPPCPPGCCTQEEWGHTTSWTSRPGAKAGIRGQHTRAITLNGSSLSFRVLPKKKKKKEGCRPSHVEIHVKLVYKLFSVCKLIWEVIDILKTKKAWRNVFFFFQLILLEILCDGINNVL